MYLSGDRKPLERGSALITKAGMAVESSRPSTLRGFSRSGVQTNLNYKASLEILFFEMEKWRRRREGDLNDSFVLNWRRIEKQ